LNETTTMDEQTTPGGTDALANLTRRFEERHAATVVTSADPDAAMDEIVAGSSASDDEIKSLVEAALAEFLEEEGERGTGIAEILGRDKDQAEKGKWFRCWDLGDAGSFWRRLPEDAEVLIAKVPNKRFNDLIDLIYRKWHQRHRNEPLPNSKIRLALPVIYSDAVFRGIKGWKLYESDPKCIKDTQRNRKWLLEEFSPELLNGVETVAEDLKNFKPAADAVVRRPPDA
jgi:hypothetical protein